MTAKIGYRVIFASSNESGHHYEELEIRNNIDGETNNKIKNKGKGWQSSRFCDYPQQLVIALNSISDISQIQILSHQSKIASKIEIWVGLDDNDYIHDSSTFKSINWKRLGYLSLDKNERSNWKARELKSVYINTTANYIKFSLHESHINTINLFNQVGIVALTVLGKVINNNPIQEIQQINNKNNNNINNDNGIDIEIDGNTSKKIRELMILKKQAVDNEDYDEAKRCKLSIQNLRNAAKQLFNLEKEKQIAVEKEDYDTAKQLKLQIERLRAISLNPEQQQPSNINISSSYPIQPIQPNNKQYIQPFNQPFNPTNNNNQQYNQQYNHHQQYNQQYQQYPHQQQQQPLVPPPTMTHVESPNSVHFAMSQQQQQQQQQQVLQPVVMGHGSHGHGSHSHSHSISMSPNHYNNINNNNNSNHPDERQIRPMKRNYNTIDVSNINPFNKEQQDDDHDNDEEEEEKEEQQQEEINPNSNSNANNDAAPSLKPSVKKGSEKLIEMFGEYTICLLNSPNWNHRVQGLKAMILFLNKREHPDTKQVFKLTSKIIYQSLQDRVAGVLLSGIDTLNTLISVYDIEDNELCKCLYSILVILVNILGHSNNRLIDASGSILISLCHNNNNTDILCKTVYNILIKKMKKLLPKHLKGRGLILLQLIPQFNIPKGVDINVMMNNLIKPQLINKNGDVRDIGIQITSLLYGIIEVRHQIIHYLENANLNDFIKESLNNSFQEISGHSDILEREPKSIKEQSRPSKTMNRASTTNQSKDNHRHKKKMIKKGNNNNKIKKKKKKKEIIREEEEEEETEQEDVCNFCGLRDISFLENEENLDLHYWQNCPMLTSCKLCEQVIEIATLYEHILTECESGIKHQLCNKCNIPFPIQNINQHITNCNGNNNTTKCPLCLENIPSHSADSWKIHLLKYPGCKANPRPLLQ